jgi:hypothetical protein
VTRRDVNSFYHRIRKRSGRDDSRFTLITSSVRANAAVSAGGVLLSQGGGIAHAIGSLNIIDTIIAQNSGDFGGGIYVENGALSVVRSAVAENSGQSGLQWMD